MNLGTTYEASRPSRRHHVLPNGTGFWKSDYIVSGAGVAPAPHAFLVEQDPDQVILAHFHEQNQFQVIARGGGTLGRAVVSPITVHYAGAYTGYGPITSGPEGLWYFTLRPMMDNGAQFLPEARARMKPGPKKHHHSAPLDLMPAAERGKLARPERTILHDDDDGLHIETIRVPPNTVTRAPVPSASGGQYFLVLDGGMRVDRNVYDIFSCLWVASTDEALIVEAADTGVEILMLQFPRSIYVPTYDPARISYPD